MALSFFFTFKGYTMAKGDECGQPVTVEALIHQGKLMKNAINIEGENRSVCQTP